jgi:hypothetical protein
MDGTEMEIRNGCGWWGLVVYLDLPRPGIPLGCSGTPMSLSAFVFVLCLFHPPCSVPIRERKMPASHPIDLVAIRARHVHAHVHVGIDRPIAIPEQQSPTWSLGLEAGRGGEADECGVQGRSRRTSKLAATSTPFCAGIRLQIRFRIRQRREEEAGRRCALRSLLRAALRCFASGLGGSCGGGVWRGGVACVPSRTSDDDDWLKPCASGVFFASSLPFLFRFAMVGVTVAFALARARLLPFSRVRRLPHNHVASLPRFFCILPASDRHL